ncbi:MFS transporter [Streptomyces sp. NPDC051183]|uniref:MFS transporter n=1 Tax=Streptomyces sp. NPDC051183 TaxID=3155165 RepID=UPI0034371C01
MFWTLWAGRSLSTAGGYLQFLALPLWVQQTTGSSLAGVLAFVVFHLPKVVVSPFAGLIADRFDRRGVAVATDLASALVTVAMAVAAAGRHVVAVVVLLGVLQVLAAVRVPALSSILPDAIPPGRLMAANSLLDAATGAAMTLGPLLGAALLSGWGIEWVLLLNGLTFAVAALCLLPLPSSAASDRTAQTGLAAMADGLRALWGDRVVRYAVAAECAMYLCVGAATEELAIWLGQVQAETAERMIGAFGVGSGLGWLAVTVVLGRARESVAPTRMVWWSALAAAPVSAAAVLLLSGATGVVLAALAGLLISVHQFLYGIGPVMLCQQRAAPSHRGRVLAFRRTATTLSQLLSLAAGALLAGHFDLGSVIIASGLLATATTLPLAQKAKQTQPPTPPPGHPAPQPPPPQHPAPLSPASPQSTPLPPAPPVLPLPPASSQSAPQPSAPPALPLPGVSPQGAPQSPPPRQAALLPPAPAQVALLPGAFPQSALLPPTPSALPLPGVSPQGAPSRSAPLPGAPPQAAPLQAAPPQITPAQAPRQPGATPAAEPPQITPPAAPTPPVVTR